MSAPDPGVAACAGIVRAGDPDRFRAVMSAPVAAREVLFPILAYNLEVARAPVVTQEPGIAEIRLQWWRDALEEIADGKRPRAHEVVAPLAGVIRDRAVPVDLLDGIAAARRRDAWGEGFADPADLWEYLDATAGGLVLACALALGGDPARAEAVRQAGRAFGLANLFLAAPDLAARGRPPLPEGGTATVAALAQEGLSALAAARRVRFGPEVPALRLGWGAPAVLTRAARDPEGVLAGRVRPSDLSLRLGLIARAATGRW